MEPLPDVTEAMKPAMRNVRVWPRGAPGAVNAQWFPSANGRESIAVITGGINVLIEGSDPEIGAVLQIEWWCGSEGINRLISRG